MLAYEFPPSHESNKSKLAIANRSRVSCARKVTKVSMLPMAYDLQMSLNVIRNVTVR